MAKRSITVTDMVRHFSDYINRVVYNRDRYILVKGKKPVAEVVPLPAGVKLSEFADLIKSLPALSADERADFAADLRKIKKDERKREIRDPWDS